MNPRYVGGTYDTIGGTPRSPDVEDPPCAVCGGGPYDNGPGACACPVCPVCFDVGNPRCPGQHRRPIMTPERWEVVKGLVAVAALAVIVAVLLCLWLTNAPAVMFP